ncbi:MULTISPECIES: SDR family oxidoreductase [Bacillus]|uniref:SDR family oxidoreductase n=1 Tax=Bacillus TaxID=1386 RepID=UPI000BB845D2|nr:MULTISPECIES: SDR family oxidoreductase [Bacillus]
MQKLDRKIAVVTGASSEVDMGTSICRKLASNGVDVFFTHWKAEIGWLEQFINELKALGVKTDCAEIDFSTKDAASNVMKAVESSLGIPSILVNNAAHSTNDGYELLDAETLDIHYAVNMRTTFLLCTEFAKRYKVSNLSSGRIINMTSGQDISPMPGELAYVATKGAISAFTKSLSAELAPIGITVNAINPGPTDSTWMNDEIRDYLRPKFGLGRIGKPEDVANLINFLVNEEGGWITGQIIHSEGGFLRS